ncbi:MAG: hypothetical protein IH820_14945, partial [Bacteroidetes bacterium]|nr:hypothetical protein [Bacteroidota bacterium]
MKELSRITETFTESVIREMTRISDSMNGLNLSQGFPDVNTSSEIKQALSKGKGLLEFKTFLENKMADEKISDVQMNK